MTFFYAASNIAKEGIRFRIVDVGGQRSERRKWIHSFEVREPTINSNVRRKPTKVSKFSVRDLAHLLGGHVGVRPEPPRVTGDFLFIFFVMQFLAS